MCGKECLLKVVGQEETRLLVGGLIIEFLETQFFFASEEAVCWSNGGTNPEVEEVDDMCLVV